MSADTRSPRSIRTARRRSRFEVLEGRALLSTTVLDGRLGQMMPTSPAAEVAAMSVPVEDWSGEIDPSGPKVSSLPDEVSPPPWRISLLSPWRIGAWPTGEGPSAIEMPGMREVDGPHDAVETAQILPAMPRLRLEGAIATGERGDVFGVAIGPSTRSLRYAFRRLSTDGPPWDSSYLVWIRDARGNLLDSWRLGPEAGGLDLQMLALSRPEPTMLYLGIEPVGPAGGTSSPLPYVLEVQRGIAAINPDFPTSSAGPGQSSPPPFGGFPGQVDGLGGGTGAGMVDLFGPVLMPAVESGLGTGLVPLDASGGNGFALDAIGVGSPAPIGLGAGVVPPLPTQAAASVGGLLPAGPVLRGDAESPDRVPDIDEFADPLLLAAELVNPPGSGEAAGDRSDQPPDADGEVAGPITVAEAGEIPVGPAAAPWPQVSMAGPGGLPMLVAGLRIAWGRPALPPADAEAPILSEDLAAMPAVLLVESVDEGVVAGPMPAGTPTEAVTEPTRPRVLRTALIGVAALTVGLFLPDLATERPSLRGRRPVPLLPWRSSRPQRA